MSQRVRIISCEPVPFIGISYEIGGGGESPRIGIVQNMTASANKNGINFLIIMIWISY